MHNRLRNTSENKAVRDAAVQITAEWNENIGWFVVIKSLMRTDDVEWQTKKSQTHHEPSGCYHLNDFQSSPDIWKMQELREIIATQGGETRMQILVESDLRVWFTTQNCTHTVAV